MKNLIIYNSSFDLNGVERAKLGQKVVIHLFFVDLQISYPYNIFFFSYIYKSWYQLMEKEEKSLVHIHISMNTYNIHKQIISLLFTPTLTSYRNIYIYLVPGKISWRTICAYMYRTMPNECDRNCNNNAYKSGHFKPQSEMIRYVRLISPLWCLRLSILIFTLGISLS